MEVITTRNINPEYLDQLVQLLNANVEENVDKLEVFFKSAGDTPEYIRILAELSSWSTVFKVAATAFVAKIGTLAAEDLWKHKSKIGSTLSETGFELIRNVSTTLFGVKSNSPGDAEIIFSIPVPSDFPGTNLTCPPAASEEEIAVYLACFAMKVERIEVAVEKFASSFENPSVAVDLELLDTGSFRVSMTEIMTGEIEVTEV